MRQQIEAFLRQLSAENKFSANTVAAYRNDLHQMADFFQEKGAQRWSEVNPDLMQGYVTDLKSRGYALTTVARKTASAKTLFKFLEKSGAIPSAPIENVGSPRVMKNAPQRLPDGLVRDLLRQPDKHATPEAKRDKAMLELLYASGMRVSDMMSLNIDDVNLDGDSVSFSVRGAKTRSAVVSLRHLPTLRKYMDPVSEQAGPAAHQARSLADCEDLCQAGETGRRGHPARAVPQLRRQHSEDEGLTLVYRSIAPIDLFRSRKLRRTGNSRLIPH
jgi:integrase/recombinase XerD